MVLGLGFYFGNSGLGISVDVVWGLWCRDFWVFGLGLSIYTLKNSPGKNGAFVIDAK